MEKKLRIYTPNNSFKIDKRLLILLLLFSIVFLIYSTKSNFPSNEENLELFGFVFVIITFLYSLFFMISNFFICETTNGEYSGYLIIDNDKITCNLDVYTIYDIEKISILSIYFLGKFNGNIKAWERKKSNGVKNYIEIYKKGGECQKYFFLQTKTENITMFSDELRTYYRFGKLEEQNYKNIVN
ncbi:hypothetical protein SAMN05444397_109217 [Flavobacterium aquidurense]|uniref:PH domain-containing protein n=1 Tax=Flavobacterium frigidimaris TaxID=262320 RepID=A0ABX4BTR2_FLAFR|nr:hypothetical protein [Flavobacterium frigidimaris]OXA81074.1 hypothetical protein B0A65_04840 [Flavobacterium frigidimaris]SDZ58795.1 hypothetical protein SAMN05444397_109217 [Flavobacterium aquidurense]